VTLSLLAAVAAAICYGVGSVLQAAATADTTRTKGLDARLLFTLAGRLPYLAGIGLDALGFVFNIVALHGLPLFLVQSMLAGSVGVTALVAARFLHVRLGRAETFALLALGLGLILLAVGAEPGHSRVLTGTVQWLLLAGVGVLGVSGFVVARLDSAKAGLGLAALAGAGFGGVGIAARSLALPHPWWQVFVDPTIWSIIGFGSLGLLLFATALQRGSVTLASAVMFAVETLLPSAIGLLWLGDATRPGFGAVAAAFGFVLTLGGATALSRYSEPAALGRPVAAAGHPS